MRTRVWPIALSGFTAIAIVYVHVVTLCYSRAMSSGWEQRDARTLLEVVRRTQGEYYRSIAEGGALAPYQHRPLTAWLVRGLEATGLPFDFAWIVLTLAACFFVLLLLWLRLSRDHGPAVVFGGFFYFALLLPFFGLTGSFPEILLAFAVLLVAASVVKHPGLGFGHRVALVALVAGLGMLNRESAVIVPLFWLLFLSSQEVPFKKSKDARRQLGPALLGASVVTVSALLGYLVPHIIYRGTPPHPFHQATETLLGVRLPMATVVNLTSPKVLVNLGIVFTPLAPFLAAGWRKADPADRLFLACALGVLLPAYFWWGRLVEARLFSEITLLALPVAAWGLDSVKRT